MAVLDRAVSTRDSASQVCKSATNPTSPRTLSKLEKTTVQGCSRTLVYFEGCLVIAATVKNSRLMNCTIVASIIQDCTLENCIIVNKLLQAPGQFSNISSRHLRRRYGALRGCFIENCSMKMIKVYGSKLIDARLTRSNIETSILQGGTQATECYLQECAINECGLHNSTLVQCDRVGGNDDGCDASSVLALKNFPVEIRAKIFGQMDEELKWDDHQMPPLIKALRGTPVIYEEALAVFRSKNFFRISAANEISRKAMSLLAFKDVVKLALVSPIKLDHLTTALNCCSTGFLNLKTIEFDCTHGDHRKGLRELHRFAQNRTKASFGKVSMIKATFCECGEKLQEVRESLARISAALHVEADRDAHPRGDTFTWGNGTEVMVWHDRDYRPW